MSGLFRENTSEIERLFFQQTMRGVRQGADIYECDRAMERVGQPQDWYVVWRETGQKYEQRAEEAWGASRLASAREAYFQASVYYRLAEFFLTEDTEEKNETYRRCNYCFEKAASLFSPPVERVGIPFQNHILPAHLYIPRNGNGKVPVVLLMGGADDCKEELYHHVTGIIERDMACLLVDAPGKGESLRFQKLYARPDTESWAAAAIDYLEKRPEVDAKRTGVLGVSMGGYYAPRAAAMEKRIKACVCWGALYDVGEGLWDAFPPIQPQLRYILGVKTPEEARERYRAFSLKGIANRITCPLLVTHGGKDRLVPVSEAYRIYEEATGPKEIKVWADGEHVCHNYLPEIRPLICDWLKEKLV